mmetsp:Transcript_56334/g.167566  ORF Transcript_56334/g.167566 Transcript_56334/m.167566 type:complete len:469 (-) Transcript_56334:90-1496(-)
MVVPLLRGLPGLGAASSAERRRANSLTNAIRTAKDNALRIAEDKSQRGSQVFTNWRAKAHDLAAAAAAATSNRRPTPVKEDEDQKVRDLCSMGFSPTAARLALRRTGADVFLACNWLLEDKNQSMILMAEAKEACAAEAGQAAEAGEVYRMQASPCAAGSSRPTAAFPSPEEYLELEAPADLAEVDTGAGLGMGTGSHCGTATKARSEESAGLVPLALVKGSTAVASCQASPRCRPALEACAETEAEPCEGLLWRSEPSSSPRPRSSAGGTSSADGFASCMSTERSAATSAGPRPTSGKSPAAAGQRPPTAPWTPRCTPRQALDGVLESPAFANRGCATEPVNRIHRENLPCNVESYPDSSASDVEDEAESNGETASEFSSVVQQAKGLPLVGAEKPVDESEFEVPLPPASTCWDWPLSKHEKKERLWMLDRNLQMMDRKILLRELVQLRVSQRQLALGPLPSTAKHQ